MGLTVDEYLKVAKSYEGYSEHDHGGKTKFGIWYGDRHKDPAFDSAAWCDAFASYCAWEAGGESGLDLVGEFAWTPGHASWFARNGRWGSTPTRGSLGFVDWKYGDKISGVDHVVIVRGTDSLGRVLTVEGNAGDEVILAHRPRDLFVGFGYPRFSKKSAPSEPAQGGSVKPSKPKPAVGETAPKFPLPSGAWFSVDTHNGRANTKDRDGVRRFQSRLKTRGWHIEADGIFGSKTEQVVKAYQDEKALEKDGAVGRITWASLWNAQITK